MFLLNDGTEASAKGCSFAGPHNFSRRPSLLRAPDPRGSTFNILISAISAANYASPNLLAVAMSVAAMPTREEDPPGTGATAACRNCSSRVATGNLGAPPGLKYDVLCKKRHLLPRHRTSIQPSSSSLTPCTQRSPECQETASSQLPQASSA